MKMASTTGDFRTISADDHLERVRHVAKAGFKYIDLSFYSIDKKRSPFMMDNFAEYVEQLNALANELEIQYVQAHLPNCNPLDEENFEEYCACTIRAIEVCGLLGIENAVIHVGWKENVSAECDFLHIFQKTKPVPFSSQPIPECQVVYSHSDYDGYRWHTTWHDCQEEKPAPELVKEIDAFHNALFQMPEMKSLDTMRLLCVDAQPTSDSTEYNLYSETEHIHIWLRLITRNRDYNMYCKFFQK